MNNLTLNTHEKLNTVALGNYAVCSPPFENELKTIRSKRYALQDKIQLLTNRYTNDNEYKNLKKCMRTPFSSAVSIHHDKEHQRAFYGNLIQCAGVWACPVCAAKIQARKAIKISKLLNYVYRNNMKAVLATFTQPHTIHDRLADIIAKQTVAMEYFNKNKKYDKFKKRIGYRGQIKGNEVTYGANGWHWHTHTIWIVSANADMDTELDFIKSKWFDACLEAGFVINDIDAFNEYGINIIDNAHTSDYLAKFGQHWGIDKEVAKGSSKKSYFGKTPFDLADSDKEVDNLLFIEYLEATKRKHQLDFYCSSLLKLADVKQQTDKELVKEQIEDAELIAFLKRELWQCVLDNKARVEILHITEEFGFEGLQDWFADYGLLLEPPD